MLPCFLEDLKLTDRLCFPILPHNGGSPNHSNHYAGFLTVESTESYCRQTSFIAPPSLKRPTTAAIGPQPKKKSAWISTQTAPKTSSTKRNYWGIQCGGYDVTQCERYDVTQRGGNDVTQCGGSDVTQCEGYDVTGTSQQLWDSVRTMDGGKASIKSRA